jgi:hypothetical protein
MACRKCERRGRYRVAGLIQRCGVDVSLPELKDIIAADCRRQKLDEVLA